MHLSHCPLEEIAEWKKQEIRVEQTQNMKASRTVLTGIFAPPRSYSGNEVMQHGKCAERADERLAGARLYPWSYIEKYLFQGDGFCTFCDRLARAFPVSCVLDKGDERA